MQKYQSFLYNKLRTENVYENLRTYALANSVKKNVRIEADVNTLH